MFHLLFEILQRKSNRFQKIFENADAADSHLERLLFADPVGVAVGTVSKLELCFHVEISPGFVCNLLYAHIASVPFDNKEVGIGLLNLSSELIL
jgi:hypothetical protein